ncbi:hypothetical protein L6452_06399 [Arctium lappa]|uniref:Uncharacterized protein n=1 Tax=Arctium lappa TaxID=4217 RepID=A0ACB9EJ09_ARCLA|nr:hypothetical protein L6452_06399 [Arctium lappa]
MEDSTLPTGNMFSMNEIFVNDVVGSSKTVPTEGVEDEDGFRMDSSEAFGGDEEGDDDLNHVGDESVSVLESTATFIGIARFSNLPSLPFRSPAGRVLSGLFLFSVLAYISNASSKQTIKSIQFDSNILVESSPEFQKLNRRALPLALLDCLFRLLRHFHYLAGLNFHRLHQEQQYPTSWTASGKKLGPSVVSVYEKYVVDDTSEEMMTKKRGRGK